MASFKKYSSDNTSQSVKIVLNSAKKRRNMAVLAVKALNSDLGVKPDLKAIK